jgi:hypothetical protein
MTLRGKRSYAVTHPPRQLSQDTHSSTTEKSGPFFLIDSKARVTYTCQDQRESNRTIEARALLQANNKQNTGKRKAA